MAAGATDDVLLRTTDYAVAAEKATGDNSAVGDGNTGAGVDAPLPLARTNALRQRLRNLSASSNIMIYSQINIKSQA